MEDILGFIFILLFIEVIFWGVAYSTGCLLTPIVSFGKWQPDCLIKNENNKTRGKKQSGVTLIKRAGQTYLGAIGVSLLGLSFWFLVITLFLIY